jgi:hypothetical protein
MVDVDKVKRFIAGLYGEEQLREAMPDLSIRYFHVGRDMRAVVSPEARVIRLPR